MRQLARAWETIRNDPGFWMPVIAAIIALWVLAGVAWASL